MIIRDATLDDLPKLLELEQQVVAYERSFNTSLKLKDAYYYDLPHLISSDDARLLVTEESSNIVGTGYAQIRESKKSLVHARHSYLGFMYVSPDYRGKGINQKIITELITWSQSKSIKDFYLDVYSQNESAIRAYQKVGFEPIVTEMKLSLD